jgi:hypothetical protein
MTFGTSGERTGDGGLEPRCLFDVRHRPDSGRPALRRGVADSPP